MFADFRPVRKGHSMKATNRGWISALFAALAVCWTFVLHGDEQASKNLFPNPSFENWVDDKTPKSGGWKWTVALTDEFGSPRYKHIGASTDDAHSGRYSLHMHDVKAGGHDEVLKCTLPKDVVAQFRGKGLKFSVWTKGREGRRWHRCYLCEPRVGDSLCKRGLPEGRQRDGWFQATAMLPKNSWGRIFHYADFSLCQRLLGNWRGVFRRLRTDDCPG